MRVCLSSFAFIALGWPLVEEQEDFCSLPVRVYEFFCVRSEFLRTERRGEHVQFCSGWGRRQRRELYARESIAEIAASLQRASACETERIHRRDRDFVRRAAVLSKPVREPRVYGAAGLVGKSLLTRSHARSRGMVNWRAAHPFPPFSIVNTTSSAPLLVLDAERAVAVPEADAVPLEPRSSS